MSEPQMRRLSESEAGAIETKAAPFIDALQSMRPMEAMALLVYITARLVLDMEAKPGRTRVEGFDVWATSVRTTIERNEALHHARLS